MDQPQSSERRSLRRRSSTRSTRRRFELVDDDDRHIVEFIGLASADFASPDLHFGHGRPLQSTPSRRRTRADASRRGWTSWRCFAVARVHLVGRLNTFLADSFHESTVASLRRAVETGEDGASRLMSDRRAKPGQAFHEIGVSDREAGAAAAMIREAHHVCARGARLNHIGCGSFGTRSTRARPAPAARVQAVSVRGEPDLWHGLMLRRRTAVAPLCAAPPSDAAPSLPARAGWIVLGLLLASLATPAVFRDSEPGSFPHQPPQPAIERAVPHDRARSSQHRRARRGLS